MFYTMMQRGIPLQIFNLHNLDEVLVNYPFSFIPPYFCFCSVKVDTIMAEDKSLDQTPE